MSGKLQTELQMRKPFSSLEEEAYLNMVRTVEALNHQLDVEILKPIGLSSTQYNVLRILRGAGIGTGGLTCGEIAGRMVTRDSDITRLLDRMEERELVTRQRDTVDRRSVKAFITPKGLALLKQLDKPLSDQHRRNLNKLNQSQLRTLIELLEAARPEA